jgi:hypothetical protein
LSANLGNAAALLPLGADANAAAASADCCRKVRRETADIGRRLGGVDMADEKDCSAERGRLSIRNRRRARDHDWREDFA